MLAGAGGNAAQPKLAASESFGLACRAVARSIGTCEGKMQRPSSLRYDAAAFALHYAPSEGWRRGSESARFPRRCTSNMPDFIGYSSKIGFIRKYLF
jgi:hypothetical protein